MRAGVVEAGVTQKMNRCLEAAQPAPIGGAASLERGTLRRTRAVFHSSATIWPVIRAPSVQRTLRLLTFPAERSAAEAAPSASAPKIAMEDAPTPKTTPQKRCRRSATAPLFFRRR